MKSENKGLVKQTQTKTFSSLQNGKKKSGGSLGGINGHYYSPKAMLSEFRFFLLHFSRQYVNRCKRLFSEEGRLTFPYNTFITVNASLVSF